jgi:hypothetical protein
VPTQQTPEGRGTSSLPVQTVQEQPARQQAQDSSVKDKPDMSAEKTADWAIESIKKSRSLDRIFTVDTLINKWLTENAVNLRPVGWTAKKFDDTFFLVSFTATDGITATGFYFDISTETGEIRNIANHPDLQQKYGIKVN